MINAIGIDPSLRNTGVCVFQEAGEVVFSSVFATKKAKRISKQKETVAEALVGRLKDLVKIFNLSRVLFDKYQPTVVAIEGYSYGSKIALPLQGEVMTAIMFGTRSLSSQSLIVIVPPTSVKKFLSSKGTAKKELMLKEVYRQYGFDTDDNNIADAFVLGKMAWHIAHFRKHKKFHSSLSVERKKILLKIRAVKDVLQKKKGV
jgi:crossover junction endodeoxyribonuclease RuvC